MCGFTPLIIILIHHRWLGGKPRVADSSSTNAVNNAIGYAKFRSRSCNAVIRVYDGAGNVIETHEHAGDFKEW
jgi:hypothetical protein